MLEVELGDLRYSDGPGSGYLVGGTSKQNSDAMRMNTSEAWHSTNFPFRSSFPSGVTNLTKNEIPKFSNFLLSSSAIGPSASVPRPMASMASMFERGSRVGENMPTQLIHEFE